MFEKWLKKVKRIACLLFCMLPMVCAAEELPRVYLDAGRLSYAAVKNGSVRVETQEGVIESPVTVKYRGTYSFSFTGKRNYSLHLKTEDGEQNKISLLGLREDDDYVLYGALSDMSRLRSLVALELWHEMGYDAPRGALCELYFGKYYKGVYVLMERPDRKSAGVPKDGALYRVLAMTADGVDVLQGGDLPPPAGSAWYNMEQVYPETQAGWSALEAFAKSKDKTQLMDMTAFADYYLFVNLCGASDNMSKNLFLGWDGEKFYPMPWDVDASFGRLYSGMEAQAGVWQSSALFDELLKDAAFADLVKARWMSVRDVLSPERVAAVFSAYYQLLRDTGAWAREMEKHPQYTDMATNVTYTLDPEAELAYIAGFVAAQYACMDAALLP